MLGPLHDWRPHVQTDFTPGLQGQTALVTGGSSGIGAAIAVALGAAGARVGVNYRSHRQQAEEVVDTIRSTGGEAVAIAADVSVEEEVENMFERLVSGFGRLDILVANSGIQQDAAVSEMSLAQWTRVLDVNLTGQFLCARAAVRRFLGQDAASGISRARGKIICMSSVHEVIPWAGHVNYAASKGGVMLMMKSLAQEVACQGIRVNGIAPGAIKTPINNEAWETEEAEQKLLRLIPYGRVGAPEDVAKVAVWLASDESDYVVGTTVYVDGGMVLYPAFRENG
jgi:glucose 1-dehydrogenase